MVNSSRRIVPRTERLPTSSSFLYRIEHYSSLPWIAIVCPSVVVLLLVAIAAWGFPPRWVSGFEVCTSAVTIIVVFTIQHTQGREQTAVQRKLDELLRAIPGAEESLIMLEEAPTEVILEVEESQRNATQNGRGAAP